MTPTAQPMTNNMLDKVKSLILSLSEEEKNYFTSFVDSSNNKVRYHNKIVSLFHEIQSEESRPFVVLKSERKNLEILESKVLDSLLADNNLTRSGKYQGNPNKELVLHKEALKIMVLHKRQNTKRAFDLAQNLINQSLQLEKYDIATSLIRQQLSFTSYFNDYDLYKEKIAQLDQLEHLQALINKAVHYFHQIKIRKHLNLKENYDVFIEQAYKTIIGFSQKHESNTLSFIITFIKKEKLECEHELQSALQEASDLYTLYHKLPGKSLVECIYEIVLENAILCLELNRKHEALFLLQRIVNSAAPQSFTQQKSRLLIILHHYLEQDYQAAAKLLILYDDFEVNIPTDQKNQWFYLVACIHFKTKNFSKAIRMLSLKSLGYNEEPSQKLKYRFLNIAALIDSFQFDQADNHMDALRKFIERNKLKETYEMLHFTPLYQILYHAKKHGYNFEYIDSGVTSGFPIQRLCPISTFLDLAFLYRWIENKLNLDVDQKNPNFQDNRINEFYNNGKIQPIYSS